MGRRPKGERKLSRAEIRQRYKTRQTEKLERLAKAADPNRVTDSPYLKIVHIRMDPDRTMTWVANRLGLDDAIRAWNSLGFAIEELRGRRREIQVPDEPVEDEVLEAEEGV